LKAVAAKVQEDTYKIILHEATRRQVTVSVVVREALEQVFGEDEGNRRRKTREDEGVEAEP
jgi:hypothetical protein